MVLTTQDWFAILFIGSALSFFVAWPVTAIFVTRPIQQLLKKKNQDVISNWVIWPWQSPVYAMVIFWPIERMITERNRTFMEPLLPVRKTATLLQWWLSAWLELSGYFMLIGGLIGVVMTTFGIWSFR